MPVLRVGDLNHPQKVSLCPSNHTICTTTQNSAAASTLIGETDSENILFILVIEGNICCMPRSVHQGKIILHDPHHQPVWSRIQSSPCCTSGVDRLSVKVQRALTLGVWALWSQLCHCSESSQRQDVNTWALLHLTNFIYKNISPLDEEIMTRRPRGTYLRAHTSKKQTTTPGLNPALSGSESSARLLHHTAWSLALRQSHDFVSPTLPPSPFPHKHLWGSSWAGVPLVPCDHGSKVKVTNLQV